MPRTLTTKVTFAALVFLALTSIAGALTIANIQSASRETERLSSKIAEESQVSGHVEAGLLGFEPAGQVFDRAAVLDFQAMVFEHVAQRRQ